MEDSFQHPISPNEDSEFREYVASLSREELMELVLQYAPESLREKVTREFRRAAVPQNEPLKTRLEQVSLTIDKLFDKVYLLEEAATFEEQLVIELDSLRPLWEKYPERIGQLLLHILGSIREHYKKGYEEDEYYYEEVEEETDWESLTGYIDEFARQLKGEYKTDFVNALQTCIDRMEYSALADMRPIEESVFYSSELPALKVWFMEQLQANVARHIQRYYHLLKPLFSEQEQEDFLVRTSGNDPKRMLELVDLLAKKGNLQRAYQLIDKFIQESPGQRASPEAYERYIRLSKKLDISPSIAAQQALQHWQGFQMFNFILKELPEEKTFFEELMKKLSPEVAVSYLEGKGHLEEAYQVLTATSTKPGAFDYAVYNFLQRHYQHFPQEAMQAALQYIEQSLRGSTHSDYSSVISGLEFLRKINDAEFKTRYHAIREQYTRRGKLLLLMQERLGKYL